jgi:hypothetical protein
MRKLQEAGMKPLQFLDMISAMSTAAGAYEKHLAKMGKKVDFDNIDQKAMQLAQLDVQRSQSSAFFKDAPLMMTRGKLTGYKWLDKSIGQFQSFVLTRFSTLHEVKAAMRRWDAADVSNRTVWWIIASFAAVGMRGGVSALKDLVDDDDKDYNWEESLLNEFFSNIPLAGNVLSNVVSGRQGDIPMPVLSVVEDVFSGLGSMFGGKKADTKLRGATRAATSAGRILGIPGMAEAKDIISRLVTPPKKKKSFRIKRARSSFKRLGRKRIKLSK